MSKELEELYRKAELLVQGAQWDEVIAAYTEIIRLENDTEKKALAYKNRGVAYSEKGDPDRAIQDYDQAIARNPNDVAAYNNRGNAYSEKGDLDQAIQDYDQAIARNPDYAVAYKNRGTAYSEKGDPDRAIQDYDQAISRNPNDAAAYYNRGNAYSKKGDLDRAIQDYDQAIARNPDYAAAYNNRGVAYSKKGDPDRAIQNYDQAIARNPENATTYNNLGTAYIIKEENYALAYENYVKAGHYGKNQQSNYPQVYIALWLENITSDPQKRAILFEPYFKLAFTIETIRKELFYKLPEGSVCAHYTSLHGLKALARNDNHFRLYNAAYMNDPEEGLVFFKTMKAKINVEKIFYENDSANSHSSPAYIGSFVRIDSPNKEKDKLFLWRTYGKHDNEEAAGACLIFNKEQFARDVPSMKIGAMPQLQENVTKQGEPAGQKSLPALYEVIYKSGIKDKKDLPANLNEVASQLKKIKTLLKSHRKHKKELTRLVRELLDGIRFLFKADHYKEEQEVRVVQMSYDTDGKKPPEYEVAMEQLPPRFYMKIPGNVQFSEVILGPKTANISEWKQWLKGNNIKNVDQSKIKFK